MDPIADKRDRQSLRSSVRSPAARFNYRSAPALVALAGLALGGLALVEQRRIEEPRPYIGQMKDATDLSFRAMKHIQEVSRARGFLVDPVNDPEATGLIGIRSSTLTSVAGRVEAKQAAANPHFAALIVHWLRQAGVQPGDTVAVAGSGSFPGLTISLYAALEAMQLEGVVVSSVAASSWGANRPDFTWLDMEASLVQAGLFKTRSAAASIGAGGDIGRGLDRRGREEALRAMARNGVEPLSAEDLPSSIDRRLSLYALRSSGPVKAYVNIGGGAASLGEMAQRDWAPGLHRPDRGIPVTDTSGVAARLLGQGTPVIHLQEVRWLARQFELPQASSTLAIGSLYRPSRPDSLAALVVLMSLSALIGFLSWQERRRNSLDQRAAQLEVRGAEADPPAMARPAHQPTGADADPSLPVLPKATLVICGWLGLAVLFVALASSPVYASDIEIPGADPLAIKTGSQARTYYAARAGEEIEVPFVGPGVIEVLGRALIAPSTGASNSGSARLRWSYRVDDGDLYRSSLRKVPAKGAAMIRLPDGVDLQPGKLGRQRVSVGPGWHILRLKARGHGSDPVVAWRVRRSDDSEQTAKPSHRPASWAYQLTVEPTYDSNILRYSDRYIDRFENDQDPGRFRIESLDDVVTRADLRLERHFRGFGGRRARAHLSGSTRAYTRNDIKDWSRVELGWRQSLPSRMQLNVVAQWIPEFYIRHQRDSDLRGIATGSDRFQAFAFEKVSLTTSLRKRLSSEWSGRVELQWSENDYLEGFDEFDDEQFRFALQADQRIGDRWKMTYRYRRTHASAQGFDEPTETRATSDDSDAGFEQDALYWSISHTRSRSTLGDDRFRLDLEVSQRRFTDDRGPIAAPLYAGREDVRWSLGFYYDFPMNEDLTGTAFFKWQQRTAGSDISPLDLGREKDFEVLTAGFRLSFRGSSGGRS